ncbi:MULTISPECIES: flagellar biosynthesis anti-sigma factor FlgM [Salinicola]|uniref:Negative regulator of flagellin synthesis n=1 Tax=Salinicola socius TaxID=404433 RepID=A0A1Q8SVY5_9GAMM|nr:MULTISPECIES: flagellar biosynthesis anti-sigma factor FlgM [Salinicola]OLO05591.1 flagellar biosynthesis anti-sigma factor FlgM [Salinicola socius]
MKIDQTQPLTRSTQNEPVEQRKGAESLEDTKASAGSTTTLSQIPKGDASEDIDTARVNEIRQAISEGRLELDTGKIADGLVQSVRDMLDKS